LPDRIAWGILPQRERAVSAACAVRRRAIASEDDSGPGKRLRDLRGFAAAPSVPPLLVGASPPAKSRWREGALRAHPWAVTPLVGHGHLHPTGRLRGWRNRLCCPFPTVIPNRVALAFSQGEGPAVLDLHVIISALEFSAELPTCDSRRRVHANHSPRFLICSRFSLSLSQARLVFSQKNIWRPQGNFGHHRLQSRPRTPLQR
jgi:hypothetical protein